MNLDGAKAIDGWMSDNELFWLATTAGSSNVIFEVGCYKGRSTRALADNSKALILAIDPYEGDYWNNDADEIVIHNHQQEKIYQEFLVNLAKPIEYKQVVPVRVRFCSLWPALQPDFIFIDGDHHYEEVIKDIEHAKKFITGKGILAGHDYGRPDWPGVKQAVDELLDDVTIIDSIWFKRMNNG